MQARFGAVSLGMLDEHVIADEAAGREVTEAPAEKGGIQGYRNSRLP